jgi:hypothetical protein
LNPLAPREEIGNQACCMNRVDNKHMEFDLLGAWTMELSQQRSFEMWAFVRDVGVSWTPVGAGIHNSALCTLHVGNIHKAFGLWEVLEYELAEFAFAQILVDVAI